MRVCSSVNIPAITATLRSSPAGSFREESPLLPVITSNNIIINNSNINSSRTESRESCGTSLRASLGRTWSRSSWSCSRLASNRQRRRPIWRITSIPCWRRWSLMPLICFRRITDTWTTTSSARWLSKNFVDERNTRQGMNELLLY